MAGNANSGCPGGNPNIRNIRKTGPKTKEGKFKAVISTGNMKPDTKSKLLNYFRKCNNCPLRPKEQDMVTKSGEVVSFTVPAKCGSYEKDHKCVVKQESYLKQVKIYYEIGEGLDTIALQQLLAYKMLENSEIAKEAEMMKNRTPGFYTSRFQELAAKNIESLNKQKYGEVHKNQNVNVNIDLTDSIVEAYKKRKEEKEDDGNHT